MSVAPSVYNDVAERRGSQNRRQLLLAWYSAACLALDARVEIFYVHRSLGEFVCMSSFHSPGA